VSGPAASGKTCLLRSWIAEAGLEAHAAWATIGSDIGPASGLADDAIVERLIARLQGLEPPRLLVIDDLQELKSAEAERELERFLTRLPAQLRIVLLTRAPMGSATATGCASRVA
jgi:LuxR family maltose regulon positive regulatory protein